MGPRIWAFFTVCCVLGSGISRAQSAQTMPILIKFDGDVSRIQALPEVRSIVTGIYRQAGVELQWDQDPLAVPAAHVLTIVLTTRKAAPAGLRIDAMGVAPTPGDGTRGNVAYVFTDAVIAFANEHRLPSSQVAGCAIAHEIGHLLLPPNAHRPDGIMRGSWHPGDFPPRSPGVLGFPSDQARLLQLRVQSR
jgi:hypothetical protein